MNNSNLGIDCRNNIDNSFLEPMYDDFFEICYIKNYTTIFGDDAFRELFSPCLLREEINATFDSTIFALNKDEPTYEARKKFYERQKTEEFDVVDSYEKNKKAKKRKSQDIDNKICDYLDSRKTKIILDFNDRESASIKS